MTIRYQNGHTAEAMLLSRSETNMRVMLRNSDDVTELNLVLGKWVTEDCEPVSVEFAARPAAAFITEADCICPAELAAQLIHLLLTDSGEDLPQAAPTAGRFDETLVCADARRA